MSTCRIWGCVSVIVCVSRMFGFVMVWWQSVARDIFLAHNFNSRCYTMMIESKWNKTPQYFGVCTDAVRTQFIWILCKVLEGTCRSTILVIMDFWFCVEFYSQWMRTVFHTIYDHIVERSDRKWNDKWFLLVNLPLFPKEIHTGVPVEKDKRRDLVWFVNILEFHVSDSINYYRK